MSWESGPALPPGTLVLSPEQAQALRTAFGQVAEAFEVLARVLGPHTPDADEPHEVHLRSLPGGQP